MFPGDMTYERYNERKGMGKIESRKSESSN